MSSEVLQRLSTFAQWPIPSDDWSPISNFVSKAAGAFFRRTPDCVKDEVVCLSCGVLFYDWSTDSPTSGCTLFKSPAAVHRVISPKCPALNPSDEDSVTTELVTDWNPLIMQSPFARYLPNHIQTNRTTPERSPHPACDERGTRVRRVLFPESPENLQHSVDHHEQEQAVETSQIPNATASDSAPPRSVLDQNGMTHPFKAKSGNYDHLFASHRLQTFPQPITCAKYQTWAEEGFIFSRENQCVMCVYCGTELALNSHQPGVVHQKKCPSCPFVMGFDVGNITQEQEKWIRQVYFQQQAAQRERDSSEIMAVKYVQYQEEKDRQGTFQGWPRMCARTFPPNVMASAGFFYSGYSDKVACFCCGVTLYDWREEADVWITHATVSPSCQHVSSVKGQDFIAKAANLQILAEVMYPKDSCSGEVSSSSSSSDGVGKEEVGSSSLDMAAVRAALACGYTLPQIHHAIFRFFCLTSRYPNEAILKASLKATDENHSTICRQQHVVRQKDSQLQQKDSQLQQKDSQLQQQGEQWQKQLQQKDSQLQQSYMQLHTMRQEKEQTVQTLQHRLDDTVTRMNEQLDVKEQQLDVKEQQLDEKEQQLQLQEQQIQCLMQQVQQLRADSHHRADLAPEPQGEGHAANGRVDVSEEGRQSQVCKICMTDKPRMIFLPCGHLFCCAECTSRLPHRRCPVCRQHIAEVLPAFLA